MTSKMKKYIMQLARTKAQKTALAIMTSVLMFNPAYAAPTGGEVVGGVATINQAGAVTTINQASQQANINWQSFGIAKNETVNFNQPNAQAIALNRVVGNEASNIYGKLNANGQVFLINPNGILFSKDAKVNVGGLVASTLDIDKIDGTKYNLKGTGTITNQGTITAKGRIAFIANVVDNQGKIINHKGITHLSAGEQVTINKGESFNVTIHKGAIDAQINNGGAIISDSGQIYLTANAKDALSKAVINHTGIIEANTALQGENGKILLIADMQQGTANINGTINAKNEYQGNGGFIETSGARVKIGDNAKISTQATNGQAGTWLIDPTDFTIAASGGDMTGAAVANSLNNGNLTIQSASGASGTDGDIHVNDNIAWSQNKLTLTAHRNININSQLNGSGTANLALEYGQGSTDGAGSDYFVNAPINLPKGDNFSTKKGSNGTVNTYTVITELGVEGSSNQQDLQGMSGGLTKNYVLGANIDAAATGGWDSGAGFTPIGTEINKFTGKFDGLGHTISNLNINRPTTDYVGLFGYTDAATISNIGMVGGSITGKENVGGLLGMAGLNSTITNAYATGVVNGTEDVGGLAGIFGGSTITNAYATGKVTGTSGVGGLAGEVNESTISDSYAEGAVTGTGTNVGGLAGRVIGGSTITKAHATGKVTITGNVAGGLVGYVGENSTISDSYAMGAVTGTIDYVGGLVGRVEKSTISDSHATGAVSGAERVGGLAGEVNKSTISDSYATGEIVSSAPNTNLASSAGGLAGEVYSSTITNSYATGNVTGTRYYVGGLAGQVGGSTITNSYATGVVSGAERVGGLAGLVGGSTITNSHATGVVSGTNYVGGLAGEAIRDNEITNAYATGAVSGTSGVGGLAGVVDNKSSITNAYATGKVTGTGINVGGLAGQVGGSTITNAYATGAVTGDGRVGGLAGFVKESSTITNAYATGAVTGTGIGSGFSDNVGGLAGLVTGGTITNAYATGAVTGIGHVGGLAGEVYSGGSTITSSYWDTQTTGQTTSAGGTGVTGKTTDEMKQVATFAGWEIDKVGGGTEAWRIYEGNTSPLLKVFLKPLKVTAGISNNNVIYNGSTQSAVVGGLTYITSDPTAVDATKIHGSANGSGSGTNAGDYEIAVSGEVYSEQSGYDIQMQNAIFTIKKAPVNVNGTIAASNKTYDGTTAATLNTNAASLEGVIAADAGKVTLDFGTGEFSDKNVGTGKTVTLTGLSLSGDAANNYELGSSTLTTTADISKAPISDVSGITANDKVYDGNTTATLNTSSASFNGMFQYDNLTVATSTGVFAEKDAGNGKTVNISNITLGGTDAGNYELGNSTATATANITPAPLTISANDISRMLGNAYVFSGTEFTASGLVNGETIDTVKIDSTGKNATVPGNFDINITGVNTGSSDFDIGNYNPTYVDGKLNIFIEGTIDAGSITKNIKANDPFQNNGLYPLVEDWSSVSIKAPAVKAPTGYLTSIDGKLYWVLNK